VKTGTNLRHIEAVLLSFCAFGVQLRLTARLFRGCLEGAQTAHFIHDSLGFELALEALESAVNGFSLACG
jgi:hypothetical protein